MNFVETRKVEVTAIDKAYGCRFHDQIVEDVDLVNLPIGNDDKGWNAAAQIQPFCSRNFDQGKRERQRSMVVASKAYTVFLSSSPKSSCA